MQARPSSGKVPEYILEEVRIYLLRGGLGLPRRLGGSLSSPASVLDATRRSPRKVETILFWGRADLDLVACALLLQLQVLEVACPFSSPTPPARATFLLFSTTTSSQP